jgi:ligand-binding SRPBCC domain-containing protein
MHLYRLKSDQFIPLPRAEVFRFFERPENLERLTPPDLGFKILTPSPIPMNPGSLIDYTVSLFGVPLHWTTQITEYDPGESFADVQLKGPYAYWHHRHTFEDAPGGTLMRDEVVYAVPLGPLGRIANALFVAGQLRRIFDYRFKKIKEIFKAGAPRPSGGRI